MPASISARMHSAAWWFTALLLALLSASASAARSAATAMATPATTATAMMAVTAATTATAVTSPTLVTLLFKDNLPYVHSPVTKIGSEEVEFRKEPAYQGKEIRRGILKVTPSRESWIPYAWDATKGQVYLDLNRDGDLTNDPAGRKEAQYAPQYGIFDFQAPLTSGTKAQSVKVYVTLKLSDESFFRTSAGWTGRVVLDGKEWVVSVQQDRTRMPGQANMMCLVPYIPANPKLPSAPSAFATLPTTWTLNSRVYEASLRGEPVSGQAIQAEFCEVSPPCGQLRLGGSDIACLTLSGVHSTAFLDNPTSLALLPEDDYRVTWVVLNGGQTTSYGGKVGVSRAKPATWNGGGPVRCSVRVDRQCGSLYLNYELKGAAGENYWLAQGPTPPGFVIFKDGRTIGSGQFEYG